MPTNPLHYRKSQPHSRPELAFARLWNDWRDGGTPSPLTETVSDTGACQSLHRPRAVECSLDGRVSPADANQRSRVGAVADEVHSAEEERVGSGGYLAMHRALEPAERPCEERRARCPRLRRDPVPHRDRRHPTCEMLGQRFLALGEQRDAARARLAQELVQRRVPRDREAYERRLQRETDERAHGQPERLTADLDRHDSDPRREPTEDPAQIVHCALRGEQLAQDVREDAAVTQVVALPGCVESERGAELAFVRPDGDLPRLAV